MSHDENGFYLVIAGNIGVGKTTLTEALSDKLGWFALFENFNENPYLARFYDDMAAWAFHSQMFFLKERLKDHQQIRDMQQSCIQDRSLYEDAEIFARNLYERKLMSDEDYAVYRDLYDGINSFLRPPDLYVYLRASIWTLISRIRKRGRQFEQHIDSEYLMQLNKLYDGWVNRISQDQRVLVIDTDDYDLHTDIAWRESIIAEISNISNKSE